MGVKSKKVSAEAAQQPSKTSHYISFKTEDGEKLGTIGLYEGKFGPGTSLKPEYITGKLSEVMTAVVEAGEAGKRVYLNINESTN